jgi:hypothetical protein
MLPRPHQHLAPPWPRVDVSILQQAQQRNVSSAKFSIIVIIIVTTIVFVIIIIIIIIILIIILIVIPLSMTFH